MFMGVEQFRRIYQGKAHKCIVADLNPTTTYRFRVKSRRKQDANADNTEKTDEANHKTEIQCSEWSDILGVTTIKEETKNEEWIINRKRKIQIEKYKNIN